MSQRADHPSLSPSGLDALGGLERHLHHSLLNPRLLELVRIRASQLNRCAYCIDMHTKLARAKGETEQRIYALSAWRETSFFNEPERAALAWTEVLTHIHSGVTEHDSISVRLHFDETQLVDLTYAIVAINAENRIATAFRKEPGSFDANAPEAPISLEVAAQF